MNSRRVASLFLIVSLANCRGKDAAHVAPCEPVPRERCDKALSVEMREVLLGGAFDTMKGHLYLGSVLAMPGLFVGEEVSLAGWMEMNWAKANLYNSIEDLRVGRTSSAIELTVANGDLIAQDDMSVFSSNYCVVKGEVQIGTDLNGVSRVVLDTDLVSCQEMGYWTVEEGLKLLKKKKQ